MQAFFIYLRNITYYLLFAAVVGMLAPVGKYKKFVSLVMGFILLNMMIAPLGRFSPTIPISNLLAGLPFAEVQSHGTDQYYAHWHNTYLRDAFEAQLIAQLENLLHQNGFTMHGAHITFPEDFTKISTVHVTLSRDEETDRVPFIRIQPVQPVQIGDGQQAPPCPVTTAAQNIISQFYNLPTGHIYVTVR